MADFDKLSPPIEVPGRSSEEIPDHTASADDFVSRVKAKVQQPKTDKSRTVKVKPTIPNRQGQFVKPLTELYGLFAMGLAPFDQTCAMAIAQSAESCAKAWDDLAHKNEAIRRLLWSVIQTSDWGKVGLAHVPIMIAVMQHHMPKMAAMVPQQYDTDKVASNGHKEGDT